MAEEYTDFGFKKVKKSNKKKLVGDVFTSVSENYDIMNDLMSLGIHRLWKDEFISYISDFSGNFLDVAAGSCDITLRILEEAKKRAYSPNIFVTDINYDMLREGKNKAIEKHPHYTKLNFVCCDAENLPFEDNSFDNYTISFGLRNCTDKQKVINEAYRVLKPLGKFLCLEFSKIENNLIQSFYRNYSDYIIPKIGKYVANDEEAYKYLVESIERFPDQKTLANFIKNSGFEIVNYKSLSSGIVAIHFGYKI